MDRLRDVREAEPRLKGTPTTMSKTFQIPRSMEELVQLQRDTTALLHEHRVQVAMNKLCPRRMTEAQRTQIRAQYPTEKELIAAAGEPAAATATVYRKRAKTVFGDAQEERRSVWELVNERSGTVGSWYSFKAAVQFFLMEKIAESKRVIDRYYQERRGGQDVSDLERAREVAFKLLPVFANALATTPQGGLPEKFAGDGKSKRRPRSKSRSLPGMPADWEEQVAASMTGNLQLAYLMECVTGCRPVELKRGVEIVLCADGQLHCQVNGAKLGKHSGQAKRHFLIDASNGVARMLAGMLQVDVPVRSEGLIGKTDTYCKAVARRGQAVHPRKDWAKRVTAYTTRHQFKTDAKNAGLNPEDLAKVMGHSTTKSQTYYGSSARGRTGAVAPSKIGASRPVKSKLSYASLKAVPRNKRNVPSSSQGRKVPSNKPRP